MSSPEAQDQQQRLYATTDASVWAKEFMSNFGGDRLVEIDEGLMIGWFANAIENAKAHERRRHEGVPKMDGTDEFRVDDGTYTEDFVAGHEQGFAAGYAAGRGEALRGGGTPPS